MNIPQQRCRNLSWDDPNNQQLPAKEKAPDKCKVCRKSMVSFHKSSTQYRWHYKCEDSICTYRVTLISPSAFMRKIKGTCAFKGKFHYMSGTADTMNCKKCSYTESY
mmetsp:Transcript_20666/g.22959  ORF Transcript_20666/g.22959 Transcript_20666/m.22959 type:complete len:107 (+) Transcript_20666:379-699(+)